VVRWRDYRRSSNVEDRRGLTAGRGALGGGAAVLVGIVVVLLGGDVSTALRFVGLGNQLSGPPTAVEGREGVPHGDAQGEFLEAVLAMTEDVWADLFRESELEYVPPGLVLFDDAVRSSCGFNSAAVGPFYCPPDQRLYLDTGFFRQLAAMGGEGDFAQAYVIGHEVGHHIQTLTGTLDRVRALQESARSEAEANRLQVLVELQADCYAGVWAHHADRRFGALEPGDVEEGMAAAGAIGDDAIMERSGRAVRPESFTHGTSGQRRDWLQRGVREGDPEACNTFGAAGIGD